MRNFDDVTTRRVFHKPDPDGYLVVTAKISGFQDAHPQGYFSIGYDMYTSERAYKANNDNAIHSCGSSDEEILKFPELAPFVGLHLADAITGEEMHGKANAWYYFQTAFNLPGGWTASQYDNLHGKTEQQVAFERMCNILRVTPFSFPGLHIENRAKEIEAELAKLKAISSSPFGFDRHTRAMGMAFGEYIDGDRRPAWRKEAEAFRAFLEADSEPPKPHVNRPKFNVTLAGDDGPLKVTARLIDNVHTDKIGDHFAYRVKVTGPNGSYSSTFYGSAKDYHDNRIEAAEAAWGVLRSLLDIYWDEGGEYKDMMAEHGTRGLRNYERAEAFGEAHWHTLEDNRDLIGV